MDLGTANTLIHRRGDGLILNEPSLVALESATRRVLAVGREAKSYLGRTPRGLEVVRPLGGGVISDLAAARDMIRHFLARAGASRRLFRPKIVVGVPLRVTDLEKRAIVEAAEQAGGREIRLVDEPLAAAVGLGLDIAEREPRLILDVGGGASEGVIVSLGTAAFAESRLLAGDEATLAVARHLRRKYNLAVGDNLAEQIKMTLGSAKPLPPAGGDFPDEPRERPAFICRGKEMTTGLPKEVKLTPEDAGEALEGVIGEYIGLVRLLLSQAPPELVDDLSREGLHLTGGGSLLAGLNRRLAADTGLTVHVPDDPLLSVVLGLAEILENPQGYGTVFTA
jgi:rod shape-determining protein MreB